MAADKRPGPSGGNNTAPWMQQLGDGSLSLGRMIENAFPDEESLFPPKDRDTASAQTPVAPNPGSPNAKPRFNPEEHHRPEALGNPAPDQGRLDPFETVARVRENMVPQDAVHPWGLVDYGKLLKYVEANPLDTQRVGLLMIAGTHCRFLAYEQVYTVGPEDVPARPKLIFARIPLIGQDGVFGKERYVLYYDIEKEEVGVRLFTNPPEDIYQIGGYWDEGRNIYVFDMEDLYNIIRCSIDEDDGEMVFPNIPDMGYCHDLSRDDPPGLQLLILSQCATYMAKVSRVLLTREVVPDIEKQRKGLLQAIRPWRSVLERGSFKLWEAYRSGVTKQEFLKKMCVNHAVTEALALTHGKARKTAWVDPELTNSENESSSSDSNNSAEERRKGYKREEEAALRVKQRFENLFKEPTEEERSGWEAESVLGSSAMRERRAGISTEYQSSTPAVNIPSKGAPVRQSPRLDTVRFADAHPRIVPPIEESTAGNPSPGPSEQASVTAGDSKDESDDDHDNWLARPPVTTLPAMLGCFLNFVKEYPQMDNATNRIKCRTIFADMGVTILEGRQRKLEVVAHPFDGRIRGPEDHARDIAEMQFDCETSSEPDID